MKNNKNNMFNNKLKDFGIQNSKLKHMNTSKLIKNSINNFKNILTLDKINNDVSSRNKLNSMQHNMINFDNVVYTKPRKNEFPRRSYTHKESPNQRNVLENTIKKYPNLVPKLNQFDGNIIIDETTPNHLGIYDVKSNTINLNRTWQQKPSRERAEILFHELKHSDDAKEINNNIDNDAYESTYEKYYNDEYDKKGYIHNKYEVSARNAGALGIGNVDYPNIMNNPKLKHLKESYIRERSTKKPLDSEQEHQLSYDDKRYKDIEAYMVERNLENANDIFADENSKNKFKANPRYEDVEQLTAAQKFGGQNLKGLKKLGEGRDRVVYALDDDKVLKIAKNPGGLTQNTAESELQYLNMGEMYEQGLDYVVMKRQQPLSEEGRQKLKKVRDEIHNRTNMLRPSYRHDVAVALSGDDSVLYDVGIGTDILDYQPNPQEVFANRQWGEDEDGNLVLLDGGALLDDDSLSQYRVEDFQQSANIDRDKREPWQLSDWQETQRQRSKYMFKGNYDEDGEPRNKLYKQQKHEYHKTLEPMFPFEDEQSKNKKWTNMEFFGDRFKTKLINPNEIVFTENEDEKDRDKIEDIKKSGEIKKPITVWNKYDSDDYYELEDGHHRVIAAQERGDDLIRAVIFDNNDSRLRYRKMNNLKPFADNISKNDTKDKQIKKGRHWTVSKKLHPWQKNLVSVARQIDSPKEFYFYKDYGRPVHLTRDEDFVLSKEKGSRDMSTMNPNETQSGSLMFSNDMAIWDSHYNNYDYDWKTRKNKYENSRDEDLTRPTAVVLDLTKSKIDEDYYRVDRGFGNEHYVPNVDNINVFETNPIEVERAKQREYNRKFEFENEDEMNLFYELANSDEGKKLLETPVTDVDSKNSSRPNKLLRKDIDKINVNYVGHPQTKNAFIHTLKKRPHLIYELNRDDIEVNVIGKESGLKDEVGTQFGIRDSGTYSVPSVYDDGNYSNTNIYLDITNRKTPELNSLNLTHEIQHANQFKKLGNKDKMYDVFVNNENKLNDAELDAEQYARKKENSYRINKDISDKNIEEGMNILNDNSSKNKTIKLYRGLSNKFDSKYDLNVTDSPSEYSTWTDNLNLAEQYAGQNGYVYEIELPLEKINDEFIDNDGNRALFYKNKNTTLNNISGNEYLIYEKHDDYDPKLVKEHIKKDDGSRNFKLFNSKYNNYEPYNDDERYVNITDDSVRKDLYNKSVEKHLDTYGEVKEYSGDKVGK